MRHMMVWILRLKLKISFPHVNEQGTLVIWEPLSRSVELMWFAMGLRMMLGITPEASVAVSIENCPMNLVMATSFCLIVS